MTTRYPWRYRCPEGHASIEMKATVAWCDACSVSYPKNELTDLARGVET